MSDGPCNFCGSKGQRRGGEEDGLEEDLFVCGSCWNLLQKPETALPLLRGHLSLSLRGVPGSAERIQSFMGEISGWKPRN